MAMFDVSFKTARVLGEDIPTKEAIEQGFIDGLVKEGISRGDATIIYNNGLRPTIDTIYKEENASKLKRLSEAFPDRNAQITADQQATKDQFIKLAKENPNAVANTLAQELVDSDLFAERQKANINYLNMAIAKQIENQHNQSASINTSAQTTSPPPAPAVAAPQTTEATAPRPLTLTTATSANQNNALNLPDGVTDEANATLQHLLNRAGPEGAIAITNRINELAKNDPEAVAVMLNAMDRGEINHAFIHNSDDAAIGIGFLERELASTERALVMMRTGRTTEIDRQKLINDPSYYEEATGGVMAAIVDGITDPQLQQQAGQMIQAAKNGTGTPSLFGKELMRHLGDYVHDPKKDADQNAAAEANHNEQRADALIGLHILAQSEAGKPDNMLQMAFRQMLDGAVPEGSTPEEHAKSQVGQLMSLVSNEDRLIHILDKVDASRDQRRMNGESPLTMEAWTATAQNAGVDYMIMSAATMAAGFQDGHPSTRDAILSNMRREYARLMMAMDSFSAVGSDPNATFLDQIQVALQPYNGDYNPEQLYASSFRAVYPPDMQVAASLQAMGIKNPPGVDYTAMANGDMRLAAHQADRHVNPDGTKGVKMITGEQNFTWDDGLNAA